MSRGNDERPEVEILDADSREQPHVVTSGRGPRQWKTGLGSVAVAAVVVGVLALIDDGGAPSPEGLTTTTSVTEPSRPTTSVVGTAGGEPGPLFGTARASLILLGSSSAGSWRLLDLDTGELADVPSLEGRSGSELVVVRGGVVALGSRDSAFTFIALPSGQDHLVEVSALGALDSFLITGLLPGRDPDSVWVLFAARGGLQAILVGLDGHPITESFSVAGAIKGATSAGIAVNAGGEAFLAAPGEVWSLGEGNVIATSADEVAVLTCEAPTTCTYRLVDVHDRTTREGTVVDGAADGSFVATLSDDGTLATTPGMVGAAVPHREGIGVSARLSVARAGGTTLTIDLADVRSEPAWLPDRLGLLVISDGALSRVYDTGDALVREPVPLLRPNADDTLLVIPG